MSTPPDTCDAGLVVVGAGPHALTLLGELGRTRPGLLDDVVVVDPSGTWLQAWCEQFERLGIEHLRSPVVHHPHPDVYAIHRHPDLRDDDIGPGPYRRPSQRIFLRVVRDLLDELGPAARVTPVAATALHPEPGRTRVVLSDGSELRARTVVLATNSHPPVRLGAGDALDARPDVRDVAPGDHVVVIGGGLSAAQLVDQALSRDAAVTLVTRRRLVAREFDVDPGWMGPKYLDGFEQVPDPADRVRRALAARGGGTVPPLVLDLLRQQVTDGRLHLIEGVAAVAVRQQGTQRCVQLADGTAVHADRVVAALGSRLDVTADPLLGPLVARGLVAVAGGAPVLDDSLGLPGTSIHVMGRHAITQLGPAAGNLAGARRASERLAAHLCGQDPRLADRGIGRDRVH